MMGRRTLGGYGSVPPPAGGGEMPGAAAGGQMQKRRLDAANANNIPTTVAMPPAGPAGTANPDGAMNPGNVGAYTGQPQPGGMPGGIDPTMLQLLQQLLGGQH